MILDTSDSSAPIKGQCVLHSIHCFERTINSIITYSHMKNEEELDDIFPFTSLQHSVIFNFAKR